MRPVIVQFQIELIESMIFRKFLGHMFGKFIRFHSLIIEGSGVYFVDCPLVWIYVTVHSNKNFKEIKEKIGYFFSYIYVDFFVSLSLPKENKETEEEEDG